MTTATLPRLLGAAKLLMSERPEEAEAARLALIRLVSGGKAPASYADRASACLGSSPRLEQGDRRFLLRMTGEPRLLQDDAARLDAICERLGVGS